MHVLQPIVLSNVEHPDDGRMRRLKHVAAIRWEKNTAGAFVGRFFNNLS
jgi:hypothetical protein